MNNVLNIFYNQVIPGMLQGEIDCELLVHTICNVYFKEDNNLLKATDKYEGVIIPTLVIENKQRFNTLLVEYVETMLQFYQNYRFSSIDEQYYPIYLIATAIANMGETDYLNPEDYLKSRIQALKDNPFELSETPVPTTFNEEFSSDMYYIINKEKPNEEAPFRYTLYLSNNNDHFEFQTIRFFINDNTCYIGAIQGNKPDEKTSYQKKIKRILYKANEGITADNPIYQTNPGAIVTLTSFIALLNSLGINKVTILPYGIQRWNDKKILYQNLNQKLNNSSVEVPHRMKIVQVIERTESYFDKKPVVRNQLNNSLLRFQYHLKGTSLLSNNPEPTIECNDVINGNNELLNTIYGDFYNFGKQKTNHND